MHTIKTFNTRDTWIQATLPHIQGDYIALSGGSTPKPIYHAMTQLPQTELIHFYQVDVRYVPKTDNQSNQRMIRETLHPNHFHTIDTSLPIEKACMKYEAELPKQFDLVILGIGTDGHTASLFPQSEALGEANKQVTHTVKPNTDEKRITLAFPPIMNSKTIIILLQGQEKKKIIDELFHANKLISELPAKKLLDHQNLYIHYLETEKE